MNISITNFGNVPNVKLFTLVNSHGMTAKLTNLGAILVSLLVNDSNHNLVDVVLGFDEPEKYLNNNNCYFGSTIGRNSNRIKNAQFIIDENVYNLDQNEKSNNLHSGFNGYNKRIWDYEIDENNLAVIFTLNSPDGDQGFPGNFKVSVKYKLTDDNSLKITYSGMSDKKTIVNMTNHSYFNLNGHNSGTAMNHSLHINASKYVPVDNELIPVGKLADVKNTPMDFTDFRSIGERINNNFEQFKFTGGYDHSYVIDKKPRCLDKIATLIGDITNIKMEVYSDCLGVQFYAGNYIDSVPQIGKENSHYLNRSGVCLETGFLPDAINQPEFDSPILNAGTEYHSKTIYKF